MYNKFTVTLLLLAACRVPFLPMDTPPPEQPKLLCRSLPQQKFDKCGCDPQYSFFLDLLENSGLQDSIRQEVVRCASLEGSLKSGALSINIIDVNGKIEACISHKVKVSPEAISIIKDITRTAIEKTQTSPRAKCLYTNCIYGINDKCTDCPNNDEIRRWYQDSDRDGFGNPNNYITSCSQPQGYVQDNTDCNDRRSDIYPLAPLKCALITQELEIDHNCNNKADIKEVSCANCQPIVEFKAWPCPAAPGQPKPSNPFVISIERSDKVEPDPSITAIGSCAIKNKDGKPNELNKIQYKIRLQPNNEEIWTNCTYKMEAIFAAGTESRPVEISIIGKNSLGEYGELKNSKTALSEYTNTVEGWSQSKNYPVFPNETVTFGAGSREFLVNIQRNGAFPHIFGFTLLLRSQN